MYIFELITNLFKRKQKQEPYYNPVSEDANGELVENPDTCDHCFLPLDSSCEMLACKFCGLIVPKDKLKDVNIFKNTPKM